MQLAHFLSKKKKKMVYFRRVNEGLEAKFPTLNATFGIRDAKIPEMVFATF